MITTQRLFLRPLTADDAPFMLRLYNTPSWIQYIGDRGIRTEEEARFYIQTKVLPYFVMGLGYFIISPKDDHNIPMGVAGISKRPYLPHPDIGYSILPDYEGQGFIYEAASALMARARALNVAPILGITTADHVVSQHLLTKLGMEFSTHLTIPGDTENLCLYTSAIG